MTQNMKYIKLLWKCAMEKCIHIDINTNYDTFLLETTNSLNNTITIKEKALFNNLLGELKIINHQPMDAMKHFHEAIQSMNELDKYNPSLLKSYLHLGDVNMDMKNYSSAIKYYEEALNVSFNSNEEIPITVLMNIYEKLSFAYFLNGNLDDANKYYTEYSDLNKAVTFPVLKLNNEGHQYLLYNQYDPAIECFKKIVKWYETFNPTSDKHIFYLNKLSAIYMFTDDLKSAENTLKEAIKYAKTNSIHIGLLINMSILMKIYGNIHDAVYYQDQAIKLHKGYISNPEYLSR